MAHGCFLRLGECNFVFARTWYMSVNNMSWGSYCSLVSVSMSSWAYDMSAAMVVATSKHPCWYGGCQYSEPRLLSHS